MVAPSLNCTVPSAVAGVTVAVSVTGVFWAAGEGGEVASMVVVTVGSVTVNTTADDVDELYVAGLAGVNTTARKWDPGAREEMLPDAVPLLTITGAPKLLAPSLNCTVPGAAAGVIVAVSAT